MKITPKKFQQGGPMTTEEPVAEQAPVEQESAPEAAPEQDPIMMLAQMSAQALQSQDCQMAMQVCQAFMQIVQQMQAPQEPAGEPVFRKGGQLVRRIKK